MEEGERDKLVKVLRMFGSDHDGEVTAAARRAHSIVKKLSLDWGDLVLPVAAPRGARTERKREEPPHRDDDEADLIRRAKEFEQHLSPWECTFLTSIAESLVAWGRLTEKQSAALGRIVNKLKLRGCW